MAINTLVGKVLDSHMLVDWDKVAATVSGDEQYWYPSLVGPSAN